MYLCLASRTRLVLVQGIVGQEHSFRKMPAVVWVWLTVEALLPQRIGLDRAEQHELGEKRWLQHSFWRAIETLCAALCAAGQRHVAITVAVQANLGRLNCTATENRATSGKWLLPTSTEQ